MKFETPEVELDLEYFRNSSRPVSWEDLRAGRRGGEEKACLF